MDWQCHSGTQPLSVCSWLLRSRPARPAPSGPASVIIYVRQKDETHKVLKKPILTFRVIACYITKYPSQLAKYYYYRYLLFYRHFIIEKYSEWLQILILFRAPLVEIFMTNFCFLEITIFLAETNDKRRKTLQYLLASLHILPLVALEIEL